MRDTSSTLSVRLPQAPAQARGNRSDLACVLSQLDRKSTRLNSSHVRISYAVFCLKKKKILLEAAVRDISLPTKRIVILSGTSDNMYACAPRRITTSNHHANIVDDQTLYTFSSRLK